MVRMRGLVSRAPGGPQLTTGLSTVWMSSTGGLEMEGGRAEQSHGGVKRRAKRDKGFCGVKHWCEHVGWYRDQDGGVELRWTGISRESVNRTQIMRQEKKTVNRTFLEQLFLKL